MKRMPILLLSLLVNLSTTHAQKIPVPFISLSTGTFIISHEDFKKVYDSNAGLAFAGNLGFPLTNNAFIFGRVTKFQKEGVPVFMRFDIIDGEPANIEQYREGDASFSELMLSAGAQYNFRLNSNSLLGLNFGITSLRLFEEHHTSEGNLAWEMEGKGLSSIFLGSAFEYKLNNQPFSLIVDASYDYAFKEIIAYMGDYGGLSFTAGLRYYLNILAPKGE